MKYSSANLPEGVIAPFCWGAEPIPVTASGGSFAAIVDKAVIGAMRQHGIVGCGVSVIAEGMVICTRGYGYAALPDRPFLPNTATRCGSLAKPVTALCALLLSDEGRLDLDAPVLPLLKEMDIVPTPVGASRTDARIAQITTRHLMDHSSGLPRSATYTAWRENRNVAAEHKLDRPATAADVARDALGNTLLDSDPGTQYQYANANFVLLARIVEAAAGMRFTDFLTQAFLPKFGLAPDEIYVSQNQLGPDDPERGTNEAAYYQTSAERYVSFVPSEQVKGRVFGEAYHGYATEASDGAGGLACTASGLGRILANLQSSTTVLSPWALGQITTPPDHVLREPGFDAAVTGFYSKGFQVRVSGDRFWLGHGGMTNHCGGSIGHSGGFQFAAVSNWNAPQAPYVDTLLGSALWEALAGLA